MFGGNRQTPDLRDRKQERLISHSHDVGLRPRRPFPGSSSLQDPSLELPAALEVGLGSQKAFVQQFSAVGHYFLSSLEYEAVLQNLLCFVEYTLFQSFLLSLLHICSPVLLLQ